MLRLLIASVMLFLGAGTAAIAQLTVTPGPGGIPIAPGAPMNGYTPGGIGLGGVEIAPGGAARNVPVYRKGAGGVRVLATPRRKPKKYPQ
jgi:hypothetical protein